MNSDRRNVGCLAAEKFLLIGTENGARSLGLATKWAALRRSLLRLRRVRPQRTEAQRGAAGCASRRRCFVWSPGTRDRHRDPVPYPVPAVDSPVPYPVPVMTLPVPWCRGKKPRVRVRVHPLQRHGCRSLLAAACDSKGGTSRHGRGVDG